MVARSRFRFDRTAAVARFRLYVLDMDLVDELANKRQDPGSDPFFLLVARIERAQSVLLTHPLYQRVNNLPALRVFMRSHAFAVWDS